MRAAAKQQSLCRLTHLFFSLSSLRQNIILLKHVKYKFSWTTHPNMDMVYFFFFFCSFVLPIIPTHHQHKAFRTDNAPAVSKYGQQSILSWICNNIHIYRHLNNDRCRRIIISNFPFGWKGGHTGKGIYVRDAMRQRTPERSLLISVQTYCTVRPRLSPLREDALVWLVHSPRGCWAITLRQAE